LEARRHREEGLQTTWASEPSASWHRDGGDMAVMGEKLLAEAGGHRHVQQWRRHIDECAYGSLV